MIGMMWRDADPKTSVESKVDRAAVYYKNKHEKVPTLCFVNPSMLGDEITGFTTLSGIEVRVAKWMIPNNFWVGIGEEHDTKNS